MIRPTALPWRRPRHELLLLSLVAVSVFAVILPVNVQDETRLCETRAMLAGRLTIDDCIGQAIDRARYGEHLFTDKAPGVSLLAVPAVAALRLPSPAVWPQDGYARLWAVRLCTCGIAFLTCVWLVGRLSEGLAPGWGGAALVTFGLGTLMSPLGLTSFGHVPAAALGFGAFVLAWARRPLLAGLAAGAAVLVEYQAALVLLAVAGYLVPAGARPLCRYALGVAPAAAILGAYDWAAFGSPFHLSYRYIANVYASDQASGFFGISRPDLHAARQVFVGDRGLLVVSPVVAAAALGLGLLARRRRAEGLVAALLVVLFLVVDCGYFLPYGGFSPGPRYFVPALPFLALGLGPAFRRLPALTSILAAASIVATTAVLLTWGLSGPVYTNTVWGEIVRIPAERGGSHLALWLGKNALEWIRPGRSWSSAALCVCAVAALAVAVRDGRRSVVGPAMVSR